MGLFNWLGRKAATAAVPKVAERFDTLQEAVPLVESLFDGSPTGPAGEWLHELVTVGVAGGLAALGFTPEDVRRRTVTFLAGALVAAAAYLKAHPLPGKGVS